MGKLSPGSGKREHKPALAFTCLPALPLHDPECVLLGGPYGEAELNADHPIKGGLLTALNLLHF